METKFTENPLLSLITLSPRGSCHCITSFKLNTLSIYHKNFICQDPKAKNLHNLHKFIKIGATRCKLIEFTSSLTNFT